MKGKHFVSDHAKKRASQRGIPQSTFWEADRQASRIGLKNSLEEQHRKLSAMLTDKKIDLKIGKACFKASDCEISTRLEINGNTFAVGIRRVGDNYSPLTCTTAWN